MMKFADNGRTGKPYAKDPAVIRFAGRYHMYYSVPPYGDGRPYDGWGIACAVSRDLEHWQYQQEIPAPGPLEEKGFCAPGAIVLRGQVHLFYQTYGHGAANSICHAVSADGFHFEPNPANPIFRAQGNWSCGRAIDADVIAYGDRLFLYAATRDPAMKIQMLCGAHAPLDSNFGPDQWTHFTQTGPLLKPELEWEQECIEAPAACRHDGKIYLFYAGAYN